MYSKVSGEDAIETPTIDVSSKEFYGEGYDDSDKRIPDMTIINKQLGTVFFFQIRINIMYLRNFIDNLTRKDSKTVLIGQYKTWFKKN